MRHTYSISVLVDVTFRYVCDALERRKTDTQKNVELPVIYRLSSARRKWQQLSSIL